MGEEKFTGLALMNVHSDISLDINELIDVFASRHPRRMKLTNILDDDIYILNIIRSETMPKITKMCTSGSIQTLSFIQIQILQN